ncbi:hypothetical protein Spb1_25150 [Planctopirus ephydatiae]|uniref:Uncharacterized protein n=1 Tax=Planctopirus ephydatiae TaxID=2528019 RepID=A0A518GQ31_9PLAN|nr:hypothetical protein Spb1_25150 [Planctopirus ephydatiae]
MSRQLSDKDSLHDMETSHSGSNPSGLFYWLWITIGENYDLAEHFLKSTAVRAPLINRTLLKSIFWILLIQASYHLIFLILNCYKTILPRDVSSKMVFA